MNSVADAALYQQLSQRDLFGKTVINSNIEQKKLFGKVEIEF